MNLTSPCKWITNFIIIKLFIIACAETKLKGSSETKQRSSQTPKNQNNNQQDLVVSTPSVGTDYQDDSDESPLLVFDKSFQGGFIVKPLAPDAITTFWAATRPGHAYWFRLEGDKVAETKIWTGLQSSDGAKGSRTYVTEKGVVIARSGGHLYWINPDETPQGAINHSLPHYFKLANVENEDRVCIVSYRKNQKRFVGMGWGAGHFIEFPMDNDPPYIPQWGNTSGATTVPNIRWGYSCYVDQVRLIYYGQWVNGSQGIGAVDLKTMQPIDPTTAPNSKFQSINVADVTVNAAPGGSYAINGDLAGNVFNGRNLYTLAHNRVTRSVWGMGKDNALRIYPYKCLTHEPTCVGNATLAMPEFGGKLPLSALPDGRMIGMKRTAPNGQAYLFKLKNNKDLTQGVDAIPLADLEGDPYMYTDFTGATLYFTKSITTFELDNDLNYDPSIPSTAIGFTWEARASADTIWNNIKFEIVCYSSKATPGEFEAVTEVKDALKQTMITAPSCSNKMFDRVDLRLTQLADDDTLMNIARVQITAYQ